MYPKLYLMAGVVNTFGGVLHELGLVAGVDDHAVHPRRVAQHRPAQQHLLQPQWDGPAKHTPFINNIFSATTHPLRLFLSVDDAEFCSV
jgi:hypothetical protein